MKSFCKEISMPKNVCKEIQCPFNIEPGSKTSSGCNRYSVSNHCHLIQEASVVLTANQYWLFCDDDVDTEILKKQNEEFIANDEPSQRQLKMQALFNQ